MKTISSIFDSSDQRQEDYDGQKASRDKETRLREGRSCAIQFLGLSKKASGKVAGRLKEQGYHAEEIKLIMQGLYEDGYLDDYAQARKVLRQRTGRKAEAKAALAQRMVQAGISSEAVDDIIHQAPDDDVSAKDLLNSRFAALLSDYPDMDPKEKRTCRLKIARFMARRGYSQEVVCRVLSDYLTDSTEDTFNAWHQ